MKSALKIALNKWRYVLILLGLATVLTLVIDLWRISTYGLHPRRPSSPIELGQDQIYAELVAGESDIDWSRLQGTLEWIRNQYDCADFRLVNLIRILYEFQDRIPERTRSEIEDTLLNFRYWWGDSGENSMCYWSENHQILFASAEFLVGQKYPDALFVASGLSGREHMNRARRRVLDWLEMRWMYGFSEFYSEVYYREDIAGLINLIDHAADEELVIKSQIVLDLLLYDVASQSLNTVFATTGGRLYERSRKGGGSATLGGLTRYYWGSGAWVEPGMMYGLMVTRKYSLPPVLSDIALDQGPVVIKQSNGLSISQLRDEGFLGTDDRSFMMQWGMEAFSNPEVVRNSLFLVRKNRMFSNAFLADFVKLDFTLLRLFHLEPALVRWVNPQSNGTALQEAHTYTYKTRDYSLYSVLGYYPGSYGNQHHVAGMNVGNSFSIFHTHPAVEKDVPRQSPNYWVGYGHLPHVAQEGNVSLSVYHIPAKRDLGEMALLDYTHAYFPQEKFDTVVLKGNCALGKKGDTYCALIGRNQLSFRKDSTDDLIQPGKRTFWIMEAGSRLADGSFESFCQRILANRVSFDPDTLTLVYQSQKRQYQLQFDAGFRVDGELVEVSRKRYDSPYCQADRKADSIKIQFNGKSLFLDFFKMRRETNP